MKKHRHPMTIIPWLLAGGTGAALVAVLLASPGTGAPDDAVRVEVAPRIAEPAAAPGDAATSRPADTQGAPAAEPGSPLALYDDDGNGRITCAEARAHRIAPVEWGHPAYEHMRDGDRDGVVCESG